LLYALNYVRECFFDVKGEDEQNRSIPDRDHATVKSSEPFHISGWESKDKATRMGLKVVNKSSTNTQEGEKRDEGSLFSGTVDSETEGNSGGRRARITSQTEAMDDLRQFKQRATREVEARAAL